ncbi:AAA domain-containing protein [Diaphorobacter caeni]|uniref:AAA domain-containing protein n=1 Tax=Diaphorobacter caeni TaxID=2784387 RepID=UPI00188F8CF9|nr:AAA domain-containing protein [Diaphorobacter caeni]MBF5004216.1 AAA family ATPase [Diaphorobacter caeni]
MPEAKEQLSNLLSYILEQDKDIDPRGFKLQGYKDFIIAQQALSPLPGIELNTEDEEGAVWLCVHRLVPIAPPAVGYLEHRDYLIIGESPKDAAPRIDDKRVAALEALREEQDRRLMEEGVIVKRAFSTVTDEASSVLAHYLPLWQSWADEEAARRQSIALYSQLFALKTQMELETSLKPVEVVWGMAVAAWKLASERHGRVDYQYPLLTQAVDISVDAVSLAIEVRPRSTVHPRLEFDALTHCNVALAAEVENAARRQLAESENALSPFDPASYEPLARFVAGNLHERGTYDPELLDFPAIGDEFIVSNAAVLFARPKPSNYLHEDILRLQQRIAQADSLPSAALMLVTPPSDATPDIEPLSFRGMSGHTRAGSGANAGPVRELYFPLAYNQEQVTVIEQLERTDGVVVQGPPGTGKTHTIANIICHFLATGRKVLVTSKGEPALTVLRSKIPEEVRALTVALLAGDREGMRQFQTSIETITHRVSQLQPAQTETLIANLGSEVTQAHARLSDIDRRINEMAREQLTSIEVDGVPMRPEAMAQLVVDGEAAHGWFPDTLTLRPEHAAPLSEEEGAQLRDARRQLGGDIGLLGESLLHAGDLPAVADVGEWQQALLAEHELEDAERSGALERLASTSPESLARAHDLKSHLDKVLAVVRELDESGDDWWPMLRQRLGQSRFSVERQALEALLDDVLKLELARSAFLQRPVTVPPGAFENAKVREAIAKGAEDGKPFGFLSFGMGDVKTVVAEFRVAGLEPVGAEDWKHVRRYQQLHSHVLSFTTRWNEVAGLLGIPKFTGGVEILRALSLTARTVTGVHELVARLDVESVRLAEQVFATPPIDKLRQGQPDLLLIRAQLDRHLSRAQLAKAQAAVARFRESLANQTAHLVPELRAFAADVLGAHAQTPTQVEQAYAVILDEVRRIESLKPQLQQLDALTRRVHQAGALQLAWKLRTQPLAASGDDPHWPSNWRDAWRYRRMSGCLAEFAGAAELKSLSRERKELEKRLSKLYTDLVTESAWLSTRNGASQKVLSALEAYKVAIRKIGKGTGANVGTHRRDAQRAMQDAQGAIPCWIMSHAKVSESLPADLGAFDLVIVDEASQSSMWALPAILRAKKILVVGDDKQVSPDGAFISAARIQELRDRFLADQPFAPVMTIDRSLYDLASTVFASQRVMLREHFRCVPAIIAYSNTAFYGEQIQPLRIPKASERMDPPLVDIFVRGGQRDGRDINALEADAIVAEIEAIVADPDMAGRSIGVVSLLGLEQAKHIDTLVRARVDAKELLERDFYCGDASMFQGGERDIMFLSMVVSPGLSTARSGTSAEQRFNVAASRARDRMVLVRSVTLEDLSDKDLRQGLLRHFAMPTATAGHDATNLAALCESGFEKDVFNALVELGYRVTPQVKSGVYRIDMVVEGGEDRRLAIECDGDAYHGPDRWPADMARQRVLERAGWTFWRCFASTWKLSREHCIADLVETLDALGIARLGAIERIPALVEHRVWPVVSTPPEDAANEAPAQLSEEALEA